jgi:alcohol dehydrogenase
MLAALVCVELITKYLKTAFVDGQNMEARAGMLLGSLLAGISFSHSDVAAVHCIAEALGGKYDTPHGVCNAIVLPEIMAYNMTYFQERYARIATAMGLTYASLEEGAQKAVEAVRQLARDVHLPGFRNLGVKKEDFEELAQNSALNAATRITLVPCRKTIINCVNHSLECFLTIIYSILHGITLLHRSASARRWQRKQNFRTPIC